MPALYVHIPYCRVKCPYCDFNAYGASAWPERRYTDALVRELRHYAGREPSRHGDDGDDVQITTIFFGGGTPSLFRPDSIARVIAATRDAFGLASGAEVTLETNPGTVETETLEGFRQAGINRISFGIQSFRDRHLAVLGRDHTATTARRAIRLAQSVGFEVIATDLIFGVPGQSVRDWMEDLHEIVELHPDHISAYGLTFEHGTAFHAWRAAGRLRAVPESDEATMFTEAERFLGEAGYVHYEISNYALPGRTCRHNLGYWRRRPYLGIGAGAHSLTGIGPYGHRWANVRSPEQYIEHVGRQGHARATQERLARDQAIAEFFFLGLRVLDGVPTERFTSLFGAPPQEARPAVASLVDGGLLEMSEQCLRLTPRGLLQADSVFSALA
jgi:oxygen-independent coproporphyrinogen-3 oxidase